MEIWLTFQIPAGYSESAVKKPLCGGRGASSFLLVRDTSQSASLTAAPSRRSDSRSLAGPPIAPLPRNRLAFSAAGGASPVSPSRGASPLPPLEGRWHGASHDGEVARAIYFCKTMIASGGKRTRPWSGTWAANSRGIIHSSVAAPSLSARRICSTD